MPVDDPVLRDDCHPVARLTDLEAGRPLGVRLLGEDVVVWRAGETVLSWQDLCIHRGTRLSLGQIRADTIECPYHGWTYGPDGCCTLIPAHSDRVPPAKAAVRTYRATVQYGLIWASLGDPRLGVPPFPEWGVPEYRTMLCGPYAVNEETGVRRGRSARVEGWVGTGVRVSLDAPMRVLAAQLSWIGPSLDILSWSPARSGGGARMAIKFGDTFVANTRDYSRANAYWLGQASLLAYAKAPVIQTAVAEWGLTTDFVFFDKLETQAFIAGDDRLLILAFRGTTRLLDWIQDAQFDLVGGPAGRVHEGFLVALSFVWREVLDFIQTKRNGRAIWVTGHSLGAALAALAVAKLRLERDEPLNGLYTFGQPRGGDQTYATAFDANFGTQTFRYVNDRDIVARVPLRLMQYSHVGTFKYFDRKGVQRDDANWDDIIKRRITAPIRALIPPILPVTDFLVPTNPAAFAKLISRNVEEFDDHRMDHYVENLEKALREVL